MSIPAGIAVVAVLLLTGIFLTAMYLLRTNREADSPPPEPWPAIAILLAVRNEAHNLTRCLHSIAALDYPSEKLRVLIGNDDSEDETMAVATSFSRSRPNWEVLDIKEEWGQAKGKANVLAQLAAAAGEEPEFYFTTDADIAVSPTWVKSMLRYFSSGTGIVSGTTVVEGHNFLARMQRYDMASGTGMAKAFSYLPVVGRTVAVMGNNMAVRAEAYRKVGGYETVPFSVTEDFALNREITKAGYRSRIILEPTVKVFTLPAENWKCLLYQRRRWMEGAMQLPWWMILLLVVQALFFPLVFLLMLENIMAALLLWLVKVVLQGLLIRQVFLRIQEASRLPLWSFEGYSILLGLSLLLFYLLPLRVKWKGRKY